MTNFKGTKGKWKIDLKYNSDERVRIINNKNNGFIDVWKLGEITIEEMQANAKLIALAPEMWQDLVDIIWLVEQCASYEEIQERVLLSKKTIKKATDE
mgnify:CR=1 FL=1